jgi:hypothetical protein
MNSTSWGNFRWHAFRFSCCCCDWGALCYVLIWRIAPHTVPACGINDWFSKLFVYHSHLGGSSLHRAAVVAASTDLAPVPGHTPHCCCGAGSQLDAGGSRLHAVAPRTWCMLQSVGCCPRQPSHPAPIMCVRCGAACCVCVVLLSGLCGIELQSVPPDTFGHICAKYICRWYRRGCSLRDCVGC